MFEAERGGYTYLDDELNKLLPVPQSTLDKPHDYHVICEVHRKVLELRRVGVGESNSKYKPVLVSVEVAIKLWQTH